MHLFLIIFGRKFGIEDFYLNNIMLDKKDDD